jgi:hypothetical protein
VESSAFSFVLDSLEGLSYGRGMALAKKTPAKKKITKRPRVRRRMWGERSPEERAQGDAAYLRSLVPTMRELGVTRFSDIELGPPVPDKCGTRGEGGKIRTCVRPYGHKGMHKEREGVFFGETS